MGLPNTRLKKEKISIKVEKATFRIRRPFVLDQEVFDSDNQLVINSGIFGWTKQD